MKFLEVQSQTNLENNMSFVREVYGDVHDHRKNCEERKKKKRGGLIIKKILMGELRNENN